MAWVMVPAGFAGATITDVAERLDRGDWQAHRRRLRGAAAPQ
jgi:6-phosphogluconate dehydrogenase (decarboxylating)